MEQTATTATPDHGGKLLREGSAPKRRAILAAARELFITEGFERSSVDAVAARAGVSKRTVYDYFGDKRTLLIAVVEDTSSTLMNSMRSAMAEYLTNVTDLEPALVGFTHRVTASTLGSSDYGALMRLMSGDSANLPEIKDHWMSDLPEEELAVRFAEFARLGLLDAPDPRLAADHFVALAFLVQLNPSGHPGTNREDVLAKSITDGVRAFLRAYGPRG